MRQQRSNGQHSTDKAFQTLRDEMYGRKKAFDESVAEYKVSLIREKERKKQIQSDNSTYWRQQMDWKNEKKKEYVQENRNIDPA